MTSPVATSPPIGVGATVLSSLFALLVGIVVGVITTFTHGQLAPWGLVGGLLVVVALVVGFRLVFDSRAVGAAAARRSRRRQPRAHPPRCGRIGARGERSARMDLGARPGDPGRDRAAVAPSPCSPDALTAPPAEAGCGADVRIEWTGDLRHRPPVRRCQRPRLHRRMPRRLHLRGRPHALHPPRRVRRLRCLRAGLSRRGDLLRRRPAQTSGPTTTRPTSNSSPRSARPVAPRRSA